ncbi:DUF4145 domain-containing protein [Pseudomonas sivasensis]|uniref:DUF4145 domain-containing protein n=1 Tax=Pseudomonas sivasensis TaxID=1880678 RepID=UPI001F5BDD0A|nr:DUF4145 domain-containing protein [Pseudomonas sivasensis]
MSKYVTPSFGSQAFTCIFCEVLTSMDWTVLRFFLGDERGYATSSYWVCSCDHCKKDSLWVGNQGSGTGRIILPTSVTAPQPHEDLPEDCKPDFQEAREICSQSPRGAAALLRLVLQKLCVHLGEQGKNINDDIKQLVKKGLASQVQQALDIVRVTGNHAVHPGELSLEDSPENVTVMFHDDQSHCR